jgi:hypothetical protein
MEDLDPTERTSRIEMFLARQIRLHLGMVVEPEGDKPHNPEKWIAVATSSLLGKRLQQDPSWDLERRWIDGPIQTRVVARPPDGVDLSGRIVWGLLADPGGSQWSEPFYAQIRASLSADVLKFYAIWFGDRRPLRDKEVAFGFYRTCGAGDEDTVDLMFRIGGWVHKVHGGDEASRQDGADPA